MALTTNPAHTVHLPAPWPGRIALAIATAVLGALIAVIVEPVPPAPPPEPVPVEAVVKLPAPVEPLPDDNWERR